MNCFLGSLDGFYLFLTPDFFIVWLTCQFFSMLNFLLLPCVFLHLVVSCALTIDFRELKLTSPYKDSTSVIVFHPLSKLLLLCYRTQFVYAVT